MICFYQNSKGKKIDLMSSPYRLITADFFDYEWDEISYSGKIYGFTRKTFEKELKLDVICTKSEFADNMNHLESVFAEDVVNVTPGKLYVNADYLSCYVKQVKKEEWEAGIYTIVNLTIVTDCPYWILEKQQNFMPKNRQKDIVKTVSGTEIVLSDAANKPVKNIVIDGYTQQDEEPTPDAPQPIKAVGYRGYFNGKYAVPVKSCGSTDEQSKTVHIPVEYPLYEGERIAAVDTKYKLLRKWELYKIDTADKINRWYLSGSGQNYENTLIFAYAFEEGKTNKYAQNTKTVLCTHNKAKSVYTADTPGFYVVNPSTFNDNRIYFRINKSTLKTADLAGFKLWLEENEPEFLLELSEAAYEEIEQAPFAGIRTSHPVTNMSADGGYITLDYIVYDGKADYLNYPLNYPFNYTVSDRGSSAWYVEHIKPLPFYLIVYGPVTNPRILINNLPYEVYTTLENNEYMTIDSRTHKVLKHASNGTIINLYNNRRTEQSIFAPLNPGNIQFNWSGTFGFNLTVFLEGNEPRWN